MPLRTSLAVWRSNTCEVVVGAWLAHKIDKSVPSRSLLLEAQSCSSLQCICGVEAEWFKLDVDLFKDYETYVHREHDQHFEVHHTSHQTLQHKHRDHVVKRNERGRKTCLLDVGVYLDVELLQGDAANANFMRCRKILEKNNLPVFSLVDMPLYPLGYVHKAQPHITFRVECVRRV